MEKQQIKDDDKKKFLIKVTLSNRQFLITITNIQLAFAIAFTSLLTAIYGLLVTLGSDKIYFGIITLVLVSVLWAGWYIKNKKILNDTQNLTKQYQQYLFELYPELKDNGFLH